MCSERIYKKKNEIIPYIIEKIGDVQAAGRLGKRIAVITNNKNHTHYIKKELAKEMDVVVGVDIGTIDEIYLMNCTENLSNGPFS